MSQRSTKAHFTSHLVSCIAVAALVLFSLNARAQTNGMTRYTNGILQYYGHGTWNSVDGGSTGAECTIPGGLRYNTTSSRPEFCNGTTWRYMNTGSTVAGAATAGMTKYTPAGQFLVHNGTAWVIAGTAPMHRWKFDETTGTTVTDVAPNPINGTFTGAANVTSEPLAVDGTGFVFDGSNDYVDIANTGNIFGTAPLTWTGWVKFDTYPAGANKYLFRGPGHSASPWEVILVYLENGTNKFRIGLNNNIGGNFWQTGTTVPSLNTWYHLALTVDSSYNIKFYINGTLEISGNLGAPLFVGNGTVTFSHGTFAFDGRADDLRFYNRALTAGEISALYWEGYQSPLRVIALTSGSTWTVPTDWNPYNNTIEVIGGGGGGSNGSQNVGVTGGGRFGGGGSDATTGLGGAAASGFGSIKYSGGNGNGLDTSWGGGGGGGAAGPLGAGRNGGRNSQASGCAGGGGGGANKGSVGANGDTNGGNGGNGPTGLGGATGTSGNGAAGYAGGGGAGGGTSPTNCTVGPTYTGGAGGNGVDFGNDGGAGGGGGGGSSVDDTWAGGNGGAGGLFGGGGGAGGSVFYSTGTVGAGGTGGGGLILIKYTAFVVPFLHLYELYESFGTDIYDSAPDNPINGVFSGEPDIIQDIDAPTNDSVVFDGVDDMIDIPNTADVFETAPFTWSLWFKIDTLASVRGDSHYLLRLRHSASPWASYVLWIDSSSDKLRWSVTNSAGTVFNADTASTISTGRWYNVAVSLDSSYRARIYLDGVLEADSELPGSLYNANGDLRVACNNAGQSCLDGNLDFMIFYGRALSTQEIKSWYDLFKPLRFVQQTSLMLKGGSATHPATFPALPSAGNTVIVHFNTWHSGAHDIRDSGITDNHGNTYIKACKRTMHTTDSIIASVWYAKNIKIGSATNFVVTATPSASAEGMIRATEYTGLDAYGPLDKTANYYSGATSTTPTSGTTLPLSTPIQLLAATLNLHASSMTSITTPGGWTDRGTALSGSNPLGAFADKISNTTSSDSADWTVNPAEDWVGCIATFAKTTAANDCPGGWFTGGYCYYDGPVSTSCTNVCNNYGKRCHLVGTQAASASGAVCQGILTGLGREPGTATGGTNTYGCAINQGTNAVAFHTTSTSVTCAASNASVNRVCACD